MEGSQCEVGPATEAAAKTILAVDKVSVHRICSAQVVVSLATAVKELVENALDAGANNIDVRIQEHGLKSIQVIDNGCGVRQEDFIGLTRKHHTSKLADFEDLVSVETFGFRGEALSSLCAVGNLEITTRHETDEMATRLVYDANGEVQSSRRLPRPIGTTVELSGLFKSLPVRHRALSRNIKREFARLVHVVSAYCLISPQVRLTCTNTVCGKRSVVVQTHGKGSLLDCITDVYGQAVDSSLMEIRCCSHAHFQLAGYISSCAHGKGRSTSDRQFFYANGRPWDTAKLAKAVNEVYRQFNKAQYPFVLLNVSTATDKLDVNLAPDKRQIIVEDEKGLVDLVRNTLNQLYQHVPSHIQTITTTTTKLSFYNPSTSSVVNSSLKKDGLKRKLLEIATQDDQHSSSGEKKVVKYDHVAKVKNRKEMTVTFSEDILLQSVMRTRDKGGEHEERYRKFLAAIKPGDNLRAEQELQRHIDKTDFKDMCVIGQFNLGFVLACLHNRDLFIVDQHASDEKFRYEGFKSAHRVQQQKLVVRQKMDIDPASRSVLSDHLENFEQLGFKFDLEEDTFYLSTVPRTGKLTLGLADVEEVLFAIKEDVWGPDYVLSRLHSLWASRACRSAVMIGTAMSRNQMKMLLQHMACMDKPWNCPHGRPTLRHLINLDLLTVVTHN